MGKKNKMSPHPAWYEEGEKWWEWKSCSVRAPCERIGPIRARWVPGRGALLIPGGFAMEFLRSWSEPGVALRLKLRFDLSLTASHATAITHRPLISIFRPARPSRPSSPLLLLLLHRDEAGARVLALLDLATYKRPRSNRPTWINRTADSLPPRPPL